MAASARRWSESPSVRTIEAAGWLAHGGASARIAASSPSKSGTSSGIVNVTGSVAKTVAQCSED
ncbi:MAG: hypothetical protein R3B82_12770 [Sandaracinaceae bacterium]